MMNSNNNPGAFAQPASYNNNNNNNSINYNSGMSSSNNSGVNDLQFMTSVENVPQNVPTPSVIPSSMVQPSSHNNMNEDPNNNNNNSNVISQVLQNSSHPIPCLFHCLFKILSLTIYIFGGWFTGKNNQRFIPITVTCIILLAMDFWVVKNITGRLLVGLRWWNQVVGEDGSETKWIFESSEEYKPNGFDRTVFWSVLYITPVVWMMLFFFGFIKMEFGWLITVVFAIALTGANTYGYWHCSNDQKAKFEQMMMRGASIGAMSAIRDTTANAMGSLMSRVAGMAAGTGSGATANGAMPR